MQQATPQIRILALDLEGTLFDSPRGQFFHTNWTGHGGNTSAATYNA